MKISKVNNEECIIQARNEADFQKALKVAELMEEQSGEQLVIASMCEYEFYIHMTSCWDNYQAQDFKDLYSVCKKEA